jgi:hypothetical protein
VKSTLLSLLAVFCLSIPTTSFSNTALLDLDPSIEKTALMTAITSTLAPVNADNRNRIYAAMRVLNEITPDSVINAEYLLTEVVNDGKHLSDNVEKHVKEARRQLYSYQLNNLRNEYLGGRYLEGYVWSAQSHLMTALLLMHVHLNQHSDIEIIKAKRKGEKDRGLIVELLKSYYFPGAEDIGYFEFPKRDTYAYGQYDVVLKLFELMEKVKKEKTAEKQEEEIRKILESGGQLVLSAWEIMNNELAEDKKVDIPDTAKDKTDSETDEEIETLTKKSEALVLIAAELYKSRRLLDDINEHLEWSLLLQATVDPYSVVFDDQLRDFVAGTKLVLPVAEANSTEEIVALDSLYAELKKVFPEEIMYYIKGKQEDRASLVLKTAVFGDQAQRIEHFVSLKVLFNRSSDLVYTIKEARKGIISSKPFAITIQKVNRFAAWLKKYIEKHKWIRRVGAKAVLAGLEKLPVVGEAVAASAEAFLAEMTGLKNTEGVRRIKSVPKSTMRTPTTAMERIEMMIMRLRLIRDEVGKVLLYPVVHGPKKAVAAIGKHLISPRGLWFFLGLDFAMTLWDHQTRMKLATSEAERYELKEKLAARTAVILQLGVSFKAFRIVQSGVSLVASTATGGAAATTGLGRFVVPGIGWAIVGYDLVAWGFGAPSTGELVHHVASKSLVNGMMIAGSVFTGNYTSVQEIELWEIELDYGVGDTNDVLQVENSARQIRHDVSLTEDEIFILADSIRRVGLRDFAVRRLNVIYHITLLHNNKTWAPMGKGEKYYRDDLALFRTKIKEAREEQ